MKQALLLSWVAVAGCVGEHEPDQSEATEARSTLAAPEEPVAVTWEPEQGTHILGSFADTLIAGDHIRASTQPVFRLQYKLSVTPATAGANLIAESATARYEGADPWFIGLILSTSDGGRLKITGVEEIDASEIDASILTKASSTLYSLEYLPPGGTPLDWEDYCDEEGGAIPLRGRYDASRIHRNGDTITFACPNGIAYKCVFWGYVPGTGGPATDGWRHHQACTGMGNARYCGGARSFTREKTPILIRDAVSDYGNDLSHDDFGHPVVMPGSPDTYYIEAGWNEQGLPICLSRIRWAGLPPKPCDSVLLDPRFSHSEGEQKAEFCDDFTIAQLFTKGAVLVNASRMMDGPLQRWKNSVTKDVVSTIRGYVLDRNPPFGDADPDSTLPFPGYDEYLGTEGMLLRNLPGTLIDTQMRPLYMQNLLPSATAIDRYLSDVGGGRQDPSFEGYTFLYPFTTTTEGGVVPALPFSLCAATATTGGLDTRLVPPGACNAGQSLSFALAAP